MNKLTDAEILKALECCISSSTALACFKCPMAKNKECNGSNTNVNKLVVENALDLINRQKAEIERLQKENEVMKTNFNSMCISMPNMAKAERTEAIKEFWNKLKTQNTMDRRIISVKSGDNLVKEMVGDEK